MRLVVVDWGGNYHEENERDTQRRARAKCCKCRCVVSRACDVVGPTGGERSETIGQPVGLVEIIVRLTLLGTHGGMVQRKK